MHAQISFLFRWFRRWLFELEDYANCEIFQKFHQDCQQTYILLWAILQKKGLIWVLSIRAYHRKPFWEGHWGPSRLQIFEKNDSGLCFVIIWRILDAIEAQVSCIGQRCQREKHLVLRTVYRSILWSFVKLIQIIIKSLNFDLIENHPIELKDLRESCLDIPYSSLIRPCPWFELLPFLFQLSNFLFRFSRLVFFIAIFLLFLFLQTISGIIFLDLAWNQFLCTFPIWPFLCFKLRVTA